MHELVERIAGHMATAIEFVAAVVVAVGAAIALWRTVWLLGSNRAGVAIKKEIWLGFALWLLLALEFELAADIVRTAVSPTWSQLGQLATIATIRTLLSWVLERDIERADQQRERARAGRG